MAEIPDFPMQSQLEEQENLIADLLADLAAATGIPLEDIMASEFEETEAEFRTGEIGAEELEAARESFELENDYAEDTGDYLDSLMEDVDVDPGDEDIYTED